MKTPILTYAQQVKRISDQTGIAQVDVKYVLDHYADLVVNEVAVGNRVRILGLIQAEAKKRPAQKAREGRNPRTLEPVQISAKPASVAVRARVLTRLQNVKPSLKALEKRLAA